jgi:hypothetical protein
MQVPSRPTIYLSFSSRKLQKMQDLSKNQTTWHGDLNWLYKFMEKKLGSFDDAQKNMLSYGPLWPTRTRSVEHGLFLDMHEMNLNFASTSACP